ncbi:MAG: retroviral-like aspartic protease family protein [Dehalococcoidia bacterium]
MGTFTVSIQVGDLTGQRFVAQEALVDTGATYTSIPGSILRQMGVAERESRSFEMADDRVVQYPVGYATIRLDGREIIAMVVFAEEGSAPLLGATTLETAGLAVDPVHQSLVPVNALLK